MLKPRLDHPGSNFRRVCLLALALGGCDPTPSGPADSGPPPSDTPAVDSGTGDAGTADAGGSDAGPTFTLPPAAAACASLAVGSGATIPATGVPDLAIASAGSELGVAFADRAADGTMTLRLQRVSGAGALLGTAVDVTPLGSMFPVGAAIASDGTRYVVCGSSSTETRCATAPVGGGAVTPGATIAGATMPALAFGAGGFMLVYSVTLGLASQALGTNAALVGTSHGVNPPSVGRPSIAPTDVGYVVGFAGAGGASAQALDASGAPLGTSISLGAARSMTPVAVTFAGGLIGASFIGPTGDAMAAVEGHAAVVVGAGASSYGRVAVAPASNGIVAAWSDFSGYIGLSAVGSGGTTLGASSMSGVGWDDNAHALAATATGFVLATTTTPSNAPIEVHPVTCP